MTCVICFGGEKDLYRFPCSHYFHEECLKKNPNHECEYWRERIEFDQEFISIVDEKICDGTATRAEIYSAKVARRRIDTRDSNCTRLPGFDEDGYPDSEEDGYIDSEDFDEEDDLDSEDFEESW